MPEHEPLDVAAGRRGDVTAQTLRHDRLAPRSDVPSCSATTRIRIGVLRNDLTSGREPLDEARRPTATRSQRPLRVRRMVAQHFDARLAARRPALRPAITSSGFFFAFMMPAIDAYRGSLSRRSVVTTAGSGRRIVSMPWSVSRSTRISPAEQFQPRGKRRLRPIKQRGQKLARLVRVVVDGLLAHQAPGRAVSRSTIALQQPGDVPGIERAIALTRDRPRGAHRQRRPQLLLVAVAADADGDDFAVVRQPAR